MSKSKQTPCVAETTGKHHCILPDSGGAVVSVSVSPLGINRLCNQKDQRISNTMILRLQNNETIF